jgi:restriction endonuclease S subunit
MKKQLSELVSINTGYTVRRRAHLPKFDQYGLIQVSDLNSPIVVKNHFDIHVSVKGRINAIVSAGDILLSARSSTNGGFKVGMMKNISSPIVAASSLYILRVKDRSVLPEYILYYLRSTAGQRQLKSLMRGGVVKTIPKKNLQDMMILVPEVEIQKKVIQISKNIDKQKILLNKKKNALESLADNIIQIYTNNSI